MGLTLITGGARSGKSTFAEKLAKQLASERAELTRRPASDGEVLYIATAIPFDEEMRDRVRRHKAQRPASWRTVEQYTGLAKVLQDAAEPVILLDCLTVMLSNILFASGLDEDNPAPDAVAAVEQTIRLELESMLEAIAGLPGKEVIIVTNELGMGLVPAYPLGRVFRDIAGRANQLVAAASERVYLVVSGIPVPIKS